MPSNDLIFDLKVVEACKNCKRFGTKASCSPFVFDMHYYKKLLPSYKYGTVYYEKFIADETKWKEIGKQSSLTLQKFLLEKRDGLFFDGHEFVTAFGSGSCKFCEQCSFPCRFPNKALVPLEATGVNVVILMKKYGIDLTFPVKDYLYRIGLLLWD
jgi:predicted metal-binding protein